MQGLVNCGGQRMRPEICYSRSQSGARGADRMDLSFLAVETPNFFLRVQI